MAARSEKNILKLHKNIIPINIQNKKELLKKLFDLDLIIIGGGGIFSLYTGKNAKLIPLFGIFAKLIGKKVIYYGVGIYKTASFIEKSLLNVSLLISDLICVRDKASMDTLKLISRYKEVNQCLDLVSYLDLSNIKKKSTKKINVGLAVKYTKNKDTNQALTKIIGDLINNSPKNWTFNFFIFCQDTVWYENDYLIFKYIKKHVIKKINHIKHENLDLFLSKFRSQNYIITMRFHSLLLANLFVIPQTHIAYEEKCKSYAKSNNINFYNVNKIHKINPSNLINTINEKIVK